MLFFIVNRLFDIILATQKDKTHHLFWYIAHFLVVGDKEASVGLQGDQLVEIGGEDDAGDGQQYRGKHGDRREKP